MKTIIRNADLLRPVPTDWLALEKRLVHPIYVFIDERFVLFRKEGDVITKEKFNCLKKIKLNVIYIKKEDWRDLIFDI